MTIKYKLPGGRSELTGDNANSLRNEQYRYRSKENPSQEGWILDNWNRFEYHNVATPITAPSVFYCYYMGKTIESFTLRYCRIVCTTLEASSSLSVCLYRLDKENNSYILRQINNSESTFATSATGLVEIKLRNDCLIHPGQILFFGFTAISAATPTTFQVVGSLPTTSPSRLIHSLYSSYFTTLPGSVKISQLTKANFNIPAICYLSSDAWRII